MVFEEAVILCNREKNMKYIILNISYFKSLDS